MPTAIPTATVLRGRRPSAKLSSLITVQTTTKVRGKRAISRGAIRRESRLATESTRRAKIPSEESR